MSGELNREEAEELMQILKMLKTFNANKNQLLQQFHDDLEGALENTGATSFSIHVRYDCI